MRAPEPQTIANEISAALNPLLATGGHFMAKHDPRWVALLDECDKLQKVDVLLGSALKSDLHTLAGDLEGSLYWTKNLRLNGAKGMADIAETLAYSNLGYATEAARHFPATVEISRGEINARFVQGVGAAAFSAMEAAAAALGRAGGQLDTENMALLERVRSAIEVLGRLRVDEAQVRAMMDIAGTVMREQRLLWIGPAPTLDVNSRAGSERVSIRYELAVSPQAAAELNWELAERLAHADLMPEDITVAFVGLYREGPVQ